MRKGLVWFSIGIAYISLGMAARFGGWFHYWDALGPVEASRMLVNGSLNIYALNYGEPLRIPYVAFPPLLPSVMIPFVIISDNLLGSKQSALILSGLPLLLFDVLAVYMLVKTINERIELRSDQQILLAVFMLVGGGMLHASGYMSHQESMTLFFILLGVYLSMKGRITLSGLSLSLAILSKHVAILPIIPLFTLLIREKLIKEKDVRSTLTFVLALVIPFVLVMLPFYLTNPGATWDALFGHAERLRLRHESLWKAIDTAILIILPSDTYQQVHSFLMNYTASFPMLAAVIVSILALRSKHVRLFSESLFGVVALSAYLQLIISKTVAPHYYVVPLGLVVLWDAIERKGFPSFGIASSIWLWAIHSIDWSYYVGIVLLLSNLAIVAKIVKDALLRPRQTF